MIFEKSQKKEDWLDIQIKFIVSAQEKVHYFNWKTTEIRKNRGTTGNFKIIT